MGSEQKSQGSFHDNGIGWAIMLGIIAILIWIFWLFYDVEVRNLVRWVRYSEMWFVSWFVDSDYIFTHNGNAKNWLDNFNGYDTINPKTNSPYHQDSVLEYDKHELKYYHLSKFAAMAMQPLKIPIILLIAAGGFWCIFSGPQTHYRKRMSLEDLIAVQSKVFPVIAPFVKFNPSSQPPRPPGAPVPVDLPIFAEALGPEEWLAYNDINIKDNKIDEASAMREFAKQLGKPWRGLKGLDDYKIVLLASFCLKASRKRDQADDILGRLALCWSAKGGMNLSKDKRLLKEAKNILKNKDLSGKLLSQANHHAFETTAMIRALQFARSEGGVLAPAQFVWLRAHDRTLWYPLNNLGRQSFHMEALGAMSHFKSEKLTNRPIPVPKLERAIQTISEYMASARARPIPKLDYSQSKKRGVKKAV